MERDPTSVDMGHDESKVSDADAFLSDADNEHDQIIVGPESADDNFLERPQEGVQTVLDYQIERIHQDGDDYYDKKASAEIVGTSSIAVAAGNVGNMLAIIGGYSQPVSGAVAVGVALGSGYAVYRHGKQPSASEVANAPVAAGYKLECLADNSQNKKAVEALVVAIPRTEDNEAVSGTEILHMVAKGGADRLAVPLGSIPEKYSEAAEPVPLKSVLQAAKRGLVSPPPQTAEMPYVYISGKTLHNVREQLKSRDDADRLITALSQRYPQLAKPAGGLDDSLSIRHYAQALRPYALQTLQEIHCATEAGSRSDEEGIRHRAKIHKYGIPADDEDVYQPALWVYDNSGVTLAQKRSLREMPHDAEALEALLAAGLTPNQQESGIVIKQLLTTLERMATQESELAGQEPAMAQPGVALHGLQVERSSKPYLTKVAKHVGRVAAASAIITGVISGAVATGAYGATYIKRSQSQEQSDNSSDIGESLIDGQPRWKLQPLNGADTSGYYVEDKKRELDETEHGLRWRPASVKELQTQKVESLGADQYKDAPAIAVEGYVDGSKLRIGINGINLPVKYGTAIRGLEITSQAGVQDHALLLDKDGTVKVYPSKQLDGLVRIDYDLVVGPYYKQDNTDLSIPGTQPGGGDGEGLRQALDNLHGFRYDNTDALAEIINESPTIGSFEANVDAARIANCNVAATRLLIDQYQVAASRSNYATGYNAGPNQKYLSTGHAWADVNGTVIDATPPLRGRTAEEAGLDEPTPEELDKIWQEKDKDFSKEGVTIPWERAPLLAIGGLMAAGIVRRGRYVAAAVGERARNRVLSEDQANRVLSHAAFGDREQVPNLKTVSEDLSDAALPTGTLRQAVVTPAKVAPYLSERQASVLATRAQNILMRRGES